MKKWLSGLKRRIVNPLGFPFVGSNPTFFNEIKQILMLFLDKFFFIFFICKLIIVSILSYKRKFVPIIVFICSARIFSYLCTHFFFIKRKADQDFIFFLIDPNTRVYCYMFAFFLFRFAFFIIYFFMHIRTH